MSIYIKNNNRFDVRPDGSIETYNKLSPFVYKVEYDPDQNIFYLEKKDKFKLPKKIYGVQDHNADRIVNTFLDKNCNMGVLLSGHKGGGKTLLAEQVSNLMIDKGYAVIMVTDQFKTPPLASFLSTISDRCVILLDEFEKIFSNDKDYTNGQAGLLTLFDGLIQGNKLFMLTTNEIHSINTNLQNRPGRIYYHYKFFGLDESVVDDFCADHLKNKDHIRQIKSIRIMLDSSFSFDVLQALVEECNRYNEQPFDAMKVLNISPDSWEQRYKGHVYKDGILYGRNGILGNDREYQINVMSEFDIWYYEPVTRKENEKDDDDDFDEDDNFEPREISLSPADLVRKTEKTIEYRQNGLTFIFEKSLLDTVNWRQISDKIGEYGLNK